MKPPLALIGFPILCLLLATHADADERDDKIKALEKRYESLEQKYRELEKKLDAQEEKASAKSKTAPTVSIGERGFSMRSADTNFVFRLRGILQLDSRTYVDDGGIKNNDGFFLRRVRPAIEGTVFRDFDFNLKSDFGGSGAPTIRDAYLNYRYNPALQLRAGKFKVPVGLEQVQSDTSGFFIERSLVTDLVPGRDLGVQWHGEVWPGDVADTRNLGWSGVFNYAVGVFNGVGDGRTSNNIDSDDEKSGAARIFLHPFLRTNIKPLKGLGIGIAGSYGDQEGAAALPSGNGFATEGVQQFFTYRTSTSTSASATNVIANGTHWRLSPQLYYYHGPFGLLGEYVISSQQLRRTPAPATFATVHNTAWQVSGSYVLTGEDASYKSVIPRKNFDPRAGGWGAFEVVARYSHLKVDDQAFPLFADPDTSAAQAAAWGVGLNWYLNRNVRAAVDFFQTDFKGGSGGEVTRQNENVFLTRLQLAF